MKIRILVVLALIGALLVYASVETQSGFSANASFSTNITVDIQKSDTASDSGGDMLTDQTPEPWEYESE